ncbi:MAG TPA: ATP-binding protein [Aggregatilineales bacterium]|nr:ATP-binding protein [Aggregatilineales bacterium]
MSSKPTEINLDYRAIIDGLGQGILLFDPDDRLILDNLAARTILGANLSLIRSEGWSACAMLLDARKLDGPGANETRSKALKQMEPVRFHTLLAGAFTPCWATGVHGSGGAVYTMITLEQPDWTALNELMSTFREEASSAISSTAGHADLIQQIIKKRSPNMTVDKLADQVSGFASLMGQHMHRLQTLMELLQRLEYIRTGQLSKDVRNGQRKIKLADFVEDFLEGLADHPLFDSSVKDDLRDRLEVKIPDSLAISASPEHLTNILRDLLHNAVLYSPPQTPILLKASKAQQGAAVEMAVVDQGYGIRAKEADRIFAPFQRAHQPQIMAEFGYGLSLYLAKSEIEAMSGRIWYESEEGVGSTFYVKLPAWKDAPKD